jgi:bile acid-coenzyme A ligase
MRDAVSVRLRELAATDPDADALVGFDDTDEVPRARRLSWAELEQATARQAELLEPGGLVAVPAGNDPATVVTVLACLRAGVTFVPVHARMPEPERDTVLRRLATRYGRPVRLFGSAPEPVAAPISAALPAYLLLTGGSSGLPKLVPFAAPAPYHPNRYPNALLRRAGLGTGQRHLLVAPLHHAAAFSCFLEGVLTGACTVLLPAFHPATMWQVIAQERVQWMVLTPTHMQAALQHPVRPAEVTSLAAVLHTAAPCDPHLKRRWIELLGAERLFEMYGSTEGSGVTLIRGDEWLARPGSVGRGVWTRIRILDAGQAPVPTGTVGDVYLRTTGAGAAAAPTSSAARRTADGYLATGDRGRLDADGYLYLAGRADDLIIVGGENVYPSEVESVLRSHPGVRDAAVLAVPEPVLGHRLRALVVPAGDPAPTPAQLRRHCAGRLTGFKVPAQIELCGSLPRSAAGKLERWRLTESGWAAASHADGGGES